MDRDKADMDSASSKDRRTAHLERALATVRMEGLEPSDEAKAIFARHVDGELTEAELRDELSALHDRKYGPVRLPRDDRS